MTKLKARKTITMFLLSLTLVFASVITVMSTTQTVHAYSTGWHKDGKGWWYATSNKTYHANTWARIGNKWYHFKGSGYMSTGWLKDGADWYYLRGGNDGSMVANGWVKTGGREYYLEGSGKMATNKWIGKWYVGSNGAWNPNYQPARWIKDRTGWWYRNSNGSWTSNNFQDIGGNRFFFKSNGYMAEGWVKFKGKEYYLQPSTGFMLRNRWIGQYYVGADGAWIPNYKEPAKATPKPTTQVTQAPKQTAVVTKAPVTQAPTTPKPTVVVTQPPTTTTPPTQTNHNFKVEHYQQNIENKQYSLKEVENNTGIVGNIAWTNGRTYTGFTRQTPDVPIIKADGSTVMKIYYNRNSYRLTVYTTVQQNGQWQDANFTCQKGSSNRQVIGDFPYGKVIKYSDLGLQAGVESRLDLHGDKYLYLDPTVIGSKVETTITADNNAEIVVGFRGRDARLVLKYDEAKSKELFNLINEYRVSKGLNALSWSDKYTGDMAKITSGSNVYNYKWGSNVELLAYHGDGSGAGAERIILANDVVNGWKNSPAHNSHLISSWEKSGAVAIFSYNDKYGNQWSSAIFTSSGLSLTEIQAITSSDLKVGIKEGINELNIPESEWERYINWR